MNFLHCSSGKIAVDKNTGETGVQKNAGWIPFGFPAGMKKGGGIFGCCKKT